MPNIGPMELAIVMTVALLILGPRRLPAAGRSLGQSIREFRDSIAGRDRSTTDGGGPAAASVTGAVAAERSANS
jgi:sec-independent protein translocase protein TatA